MYIRGGLSEDLPDAALVTDWLRQRRGGRVDLTVPRRGRRRELVAMVEENAVLALQTHLLSREGRHQTVLAELQQALSLPGPPHRIEAFDISTTQGTETVASMVVWQDGDMKRDDYKRFRIRSVAGTDDFAAMEEVLEIYAQPYDLTHPVICMDGQPVQLIKEIRTPLPATPTQPVRVDYQYERAGTASIFMFTEPLSSWRQATARPRRTKEVGVLLY